MWEIGEQWFQVPETEWVWEAVSDRQLKCVASPMPGRVGARLDVSRDTFEHWIKEGMLRRVGDQNKDIAEYYHAITEDTNV